MTPKVDLNGWLKTLILVIWGVLVAGGGIIWSTVNANEIKRQDSEKQIIAQISDNNRSISVLQANYESIKADLMEIKHLLRRSYKPTMVRGEDNQ